MVERLAYSLGMAIDDGPEFLKTGVLDPEAYDVINIKALKSSVPVIADVQPSGTGLVEAIFIYSDNYEALSFTVDLVATPIVLNAPMVLIGAGAVALLGVTQKEFTFTNASATTDANIKILVARQAEQEGT